MGYFPGGESLISDLAHYERSGELCSAILAAPQTDLERAYAWGWVAHCVADQILHPLINRGVGALLKDDPHLEVPYADHCAAHVQVELGLDAWWAGRVPRLIPAPAERKSRTAFDDVSSVATAFSQTYGGLDWRTSLARSHRAANQWMGRWIRLARMYTACPAWQPAGAARACAAWALLPGRWITCLLSPQAAPRGLFRAVPPPAWLICDCQRLMATFEEQFLVHLSNGTADLPNYNLDTGGLDESPLAYAPAARAQRELQRLLNGAPPRGPAAPRG